jgi:hypothetical protein
MSESQSYTRRRFCQIVALSAAVLTGVAVGNTAGASGAGEISGIWYNSDYDPKRVYHPRMQRLLTIDGDPPPFQPWAAELYEKRLKDAEEGNVFPTPLSQCLPSGVPAMLFYPRLPIQILETEGQVTMLIEQLRNFRIIQLDSEHQDDPDPSFFGDSVGHWEGDTLVVDTIALTTKTTIDQPGMPHSEELHVVERYRRLDDDILELRVTIDDPKVFTEPWTTVTHFKPARRQLEEYICENQRNAQADDGSIGLQMPSESE